MFVHIQPEFKDITDKENSFLVSNISSLQILMTPLFVYYIRPTFVDVVIHKMLI
jgi:hypothetical protein